ncbi:unnamed protein product [Laminaria digitata]
MIVFGDSISDAGRRFDAPASFQFDRIGTFPFTELFEEPDSNVSDGAYLPSAGYVTNGKAWPGWLRVPKDLNYATSSGTASEAFRSRESCFGYTGEGEEFPTGTLSEQVTRYFNDVLDHTDETLGYTHVINIGNNDMGAVFSALNRFTIGGAGYVDPVAFENVFEVIDGVPTLTLAPGIDRLIERGVTGRILLANLIPPVSELCLGGGLAETFYEAYLQLRLEAGAIAEANPQVRILSFHDLTLAILTQPEVFESLGFTTLTEPCLVLDFVIDDTAEIMGTQVNNMADRGAGCQEECALCVDQTSPCQNCLEGNPSATVCDTPETYIFWDSLHFTTEFHQILAEATRQCSKDKPNYDRPFVNLLCPEGV